MQSSRSSTHLIPRSGTFVEFFTVTWRRILLIVTPFRKGLERFVQPFVELTEEVTSFCLAEFLILLNGDLIELGRKQVVVHISFTGIVLVIDV